MSKIGKQPIPIPEGVSIETKGALVKVSGPKGTLEKQVSDNLNLELKEKELILTPKTDDKQTKALWGTWRSIINNMVKGVSKGFSKTLEYKGVGYKALIEGKTLNLSLGFSHPVRIEAPQGIEFKTEKNTLSVTGIDKELVGKIAARIRQIRPPEPYKGTGIKYQKEVIRRKEGKKAVSAGF